MKRKFLTFSFIFIFAISYSQISTNDSLIIGYVNDFIKEGTIRGLSVRDSIIDKVEYILIAPSNIYIENLSKTNRDTKTILLSDNVRLDRLILKATLYRELFYILGVPYGTYFIMNKERPKWFSYAAFSYSDIMKIELDRVMELLQ
jgi:hypothetical protein